MKKKINIIATGGTIEKDYIEADGRMDNVRDNLQMMLGRLRLPGLKVNTFRLLNKDSLYMTDQDRNLILETVEKLLAENAPILITHGTDTMAETANYLKKNLPDINVPIGFTGAMVPFGFEKSDALQNITESLALLPHLDPGFYIIFHSQVILAENAKKDRINGTFIDIS